MSREHPLADVDTPDRDLTAAETRERDQHGPALWAWNRYLTRAPAAHTMVDAIRFGTPLLARQRPRGEDALPGGVDGYVNPDAAFAWLREARIADATGSVPLATTTTPEAMTAALEWMGARLVRTLLPQGETDRRSPYRDVPGWFRVSAEIWGRLWGTAYVPVLRPMPGRPSRQAAALPRAVAMRRSAMALDPDLVLRLATAVVREYTPTLQWDVSLTQVRPLYLRGRGRPSRIDPHRLDTTHALVSVAALAGLTMKRGVDFGTVGVDAAAMRIAVVATVARYPGLAELVEKVQDFRTGRQVRRSGGWVRVGTDGRTITPAEQQAMRDELRTDQRSVADRGTGWT